MAKTVYRKNIRQWEQWGRVAVGVVMIVAAFAISSTVGTVVLLASGATMVVTGLYGWCPACALVGRKLAEEGAGHG